MEILNEGKMIKGFFFFFFPHIDANLDFQFHDIFILQVEPLGKSVFSYSYEKKKPHKIGIQINKIQISTI